MRGEVQPDRSVRRARPSGNGVSRGRSSSDHAVRPETTKDAQKDDSGATAIPGTPDNQKRAVALKLIVIARQLGQRFDQVVEGDGLTRAKWSVIVAVARRAGATQRTIASMLEITEVTAGQLIDRLCADGYLERRANPKDRRAYCIHLAPTAQPLLLKLGEMARIHEDQTFAGLAEDDLFRLDALLDLVARNLASARSKDEEKKLLALRGPLSGNR
jgi:MarR family transcriptional regulator for hemolysin